MHLFKNKLLHCTVPTSTCMHFNYMYNYTIDPKSKLAPDEKSNTTVMQCITFHKENK